MRKHPEDASASLGDTVGLLQVLAANYGSALPHLYGTDLKQFISALSDPGMQETLNGVLESLAFNTTELTAPPDVSTRLELSNFIPPDYMHIDSCENCGANAT